MRMHRIEDAARLAMGNLADCESSPACTPTAAPRPIIRVVGQAVGLAALFVFMWLVA